MGDDIGPFADRRDAGRRLALRLAEYRDRGDVLVLALTRGGVPVGHEVATILRAPLDVIVVRKLGFPGQPELAMGAIASGGIRVLEPGVVESLGIPDEVIEEVTAREAKELQRREHLYRGDVPRANPAGMTVIVVDDGIATGSSMRAAIASVRAQGAARVIVAVPVAPLPARGVMERLADDFVCVAEPADFFAVGQWYVDFGQTSDDEVTQLLASAHTAKEARDGARSLIAGAKRPLPERAGGGTVTVAPRLSGKRIAKHRTLTR